MSLIGTYADRNNPTFKIETFKMLIPQFRSFVDSVEGRELYDFYEKKANDKILQSIFGTDWEEAMCLYIAFQLSEYCKVSELPGNTLQDVAGSVGVEGVINNESIGGVYVGYGYDKTIVNKPDSIYFNSNRYGQRLMALYKTKGVPCVLVATPD